MKKAYDSGKLNELAQRVLKVLQQPVTDDNLKGHLSMDNWEWPSGVALYGIFKTYESTGDEEILAYLKAWYARELAKTPPHRNVNTVAPMLTLSCLYQVTGDESYLPHIESWADWVMNTMPRTEFGGLQHMTVWNKHYQQLWADTLFMTVLFLLKTGLVLKRPELVEEAKFQFLIHIKYLQDKRTGLWVHGWTFDCRHDFAGAHWARANCWFTAAGAELLSLLPQEDASTRLIRAALEDQIHSLWKLQRENGLFTTLLDVEECYEETSATAGIAYGVLKLVRLCLIDDGYREMAEKAADAVIGKISPDGTVTGVSTGTGMGHDLQHYKDIAICPTAYGQGLTFLMLTELESALKQRGQCQ
ncbi:MAG: glycoside hydrolase family 88 protein [Eubacteriales bacterium]|nr:glycoside hydrolase family 88 protein [Eubacteriales bacterium]